MNSVGEIFQNTIQCQLQGIPGAVYICDDEIVTQAELWPWKQCARFTAAKK